MSLQDSVRAGTVDVVDSIKTIELRLADLAGRRSAEDERYKRLLGEVKRRREIEASRKLEAERIDIQVRDLNDQIESLEQKRQELIAKLLALQGEAESVNGELRLAREEIQQAQGVANNSRKQGEETSREIANLTEERRIWGAKMREACLSALDRSLSEMEGRVREFFVSQDERRKQLDAAARFRQARHEDWDVGRLCDERDQLLSFIEKATVPGVLELLQAKVASIELDLDGRYPGALDAVNVVAPVRYIEELYYWIDRTGMVKIFLPFNSIDWEETRVGVWSHKTIGALRFAWAMIKGAGFKPTDGEFSLERDRWIFDGKIDAETADLLDSFSMVVADVGEISFVFTRVPIEVEEALNENSYT